jgi:hypothetical protein
MTTPHHDGHAARGGERAQPLGRAADIWRRHVDDRRASRVREVGELDRGEVRVVEDEVVEHGARVGSEGCRIEL